jgi:hypothetical protein
VAAGFAIQIGFSPSQAHSNNIDSKFEAFLAIHLFENVTAQELVVLAQTGV